MQIDSALYERGRLTLSVPDIREAMKFAYGFKPGNYAIKPEKKKRSNDANAYCWKLCTDISNAIRMSKEEIYRAAIREGNTFIQCIIPNVKRDEFCKVWQSNGIGWFCVIIDQQDSQNTLIHAYQGSSTYDTKQMSELIERLVQDAKALEIETLSEREQSLLLEEWGR